MVPIQLPVFESDPVKRLQTMHQTLDDIIKNSTLPFGFLAAAWIVGLLISIKKPSNQTRVSPLGSLAMTNFPTPDVPLKIFGQEGVYMRMSFGFPKSGYPIAVASVSFKGDLLFHIKVDAGLFPKEEDSENVLRFIEDELDFLLRISSITSEEEQEV
jgi:hypothetical protein